MILRRSTVVSFVFCFSPLIFIRCGGGVAVVLVLGVSHMLSVLAMDFFWSLCCSEHSILRFSSVFFRLDASVSFINGSLFYVFLPPVDGFLGA